MKLKRVQHRTAGLLLWAQQHLQQHEAATQHAAADAGSATVLAYVGR